MDGGPVHFRMLVDKAKAGGVIGKVCWRGVVWRSQAMLQCCWAGATRGRVTRTAAGPCAARAPTAR
jgi:hypothetical protein